MAEVLFLVLRRLRAPLIVLIAVYAVSIAGLVAIPGVDPDGRPWRMSFFHALYVMSYTATTIGFGEIPYPFTDAQRLWVTAAIYLSVVGWAYAIGTVFALSQDAAFRAATARGLFVRRVARLREPFCVVCGYGRSGHAIAAALDALGARIVIVDADPLRLAPIEIQPFRAVPLVLAADARRPEVLRDAGIAQPECRAVIALTGDDEANQAIAIGTRVLDPTTRVIARVVEPVVEANLAAFGDVQVINPYRTFATNVGLGFGAPEVLQLEEWLTGAPGTQRPEPLRLPRGHWVLAGYGRFGQPLAAALEEAGQSWQAFDPGVATPDGAADRVLGCGGPEEGLRECGIERAVGVIAGTDSDTSNLAVIAMARRVAPRAAIVVRRNKAYNSALFEAAAPTATFVQSDVMVHEVLQALTTPLLERFLALAREDGAAVARQAIAELEAAFGDRVPRVWTFECDLSRPGLRQAFEGDAPPRVGELLLDPRDPSVRLRAVPLLLARGRADPTPPAAALAARARTPVRGEVLDRRPTSGRDVVMPEPELELQPGDRLLIAGDEGVEALQRRFLLDPSPIAFVRTGREPARGWLFRRLERGRARRVPPG